MGFHYFSNPPVKIKSKRELPHRNAYDFIFNIQLNVKITKYERETDTVEKGEHVGRVVLLCSGSLNLTSDLKTGNVSY